MSNEARKEALKSAKRGRDVVHSNERYRDGNNTLEAVLLDLLHYAARDGLDFEEPLRYARQAFEEETKDGPRQEV